MTECNACGARVRDNEHYCGNCGAQLTHSSVDFDSLSATLGDDDNVQPHEGREWATTLEPEEADETPITAEQPVYEAAPAAAVVEAREPSGSLETTVVPPEELAESSARISSDSLGGSFTDNVQAPGKTSTPRESTTGGHRPSVKQLSSNTVLNGRYEIVRRIGGGGMGAVYLAKDRNLGDAPRAVKEMVESHLDPTQHEKAIGDFKRESLLLTSLEHPSIPTIYDYFYDDGNESFLPRDEIHLGWRSRFANACGSRRQDRREDSHRLGHAGGRRARLSALATEADHLSRSEAGEPDDRRQHGSSDADRFRYRSLGYAAGERCDGGRHDGLCAAGTLQRASAAGFGRLQSRRDDVSPVDRSRSTGQSAADF